MSDRQAFTAIVYVLRTGIQWNALPRELGASSTVHDRFQEWEKVGFFKALWQVGLHEYDDVQGIQWEWQAVAGVMTNAPDLRHRDRSSSRLPVATGNQTQEASQWSRDSFGPRRRWSQSS